MSKNKSRKHKAKQIAQAKRYNPGKGSPRKVWYKSLSQLVKVGGIFASLLGIYTFFSPRVSITPTSAINRVDTLTTPYTILNDGWLTLYNVDVSCIYLDVVTELPLEFRLPRIE